MKIFLTQMDLPVLCPLSVPPNLWRVMWLSDSVTNRCKNLSCYSQLKLYTSMYQVCSCAIVIVRKQQLLWCHSTVLMDIWYIDWYTFKLCRLWVGVHILALKGQIFSLKLLKFTEASDSKIPIRTNFFRCDSCNSKKSVQGSVEPINT